MDDLEQNSKDLSQSNSSILREMLEVRGTTSNRNLDDGVVGGIAQTKMVEVDEMTLKADNQKRYRASGEARPIGGMSKANCREIWKMVELSGVEPLTSSLPAKRSPS